MLGSISRTHFSDVLRWSLLAVYGGLWIDSTIYLTKKLYLEDTNGLITLKTDADNENKYISMGRWSIFFIGVPEGYQPAREIMNHLFRYWTTENKVIDYFLTDYIFEYVNNSSSVLRHDIEKNNNYADDIYFLLDRLDMEMTEQISDRIRSVKLGVFKMSYKFTIDKKLSLRSVYSYLKSNEI